MLGGTGLRHALLNGLQRYGDYLEATYPTILSRQAGSLGERFLVTKSRFHDGQRRR